MDQFDEDPRGVNPYDIDDMMKFEIARLKKFNSELLKAALEVSEKSEFCPVVAHSSINMKDCKVVRLYQAGKLPECIICRENHLKSLT